MSSKLNYSAMDFYILPSILSADISRLGEEVSAVMEAGADFIHFDVMDNHYVPNLSFGPLFCDALMKKFPYLPIDVHLMAKPVDALIESFAKAKAKRISIHPDASLHLDRSLELINELGCKAGLVLNPATPIEVIQWCEHRLSYIVVMTVNPGFGGQTLIPTLVKKIQVIKSHFPNLPICVDGGVNLDNIARLAKAGASEFVAGSAIFHSPNYRKIIQDMRLQLSTI